MEGKEAGAAAIPQPRSGEPDGSYELQRLLDLARAHLDMDLAWISEFADDQQLIQVVSGDVAALNVVVGNPVSRELAITRELGIGSYLAAPLHGMTGTTIGMVGCLNRTAGPDPDAQAGRFLTLIAELVSDQLRRPARLAVGTAQEDAARIRKVLETQALHMVFQPVVRLRDGACIAYEALARFDDRAFPTPAHAFEAAARAGIGMELELLAVERALSHLNDLPPGMWLGINLSAEALVIPQVQETLLKHAHQRIGVEVTEHTPVNDYDKLIAATDPLRAAGVQIVIDHAGAGYASFRHILKLRPSVIKIDLEIVRHIDTDPVRQALTRSLVAFAADIGAALVAEGIETPSEREMLKGLGVGFGQGYLLGRPAPPV